MPQLGFISRLNFRFGVSFLWFFFGLLRFSFFLALLGSRTILSPIHMRLRVPVHVKTISTVWLEEKFLEVRLKLCLCKGFKHGNLGLLSIKLIWMSGELVTPESIEFLIQVLVFLRNWGLDWTHICGKNIICHFSDFGPHPCEENVKSFTDVLAVLSRWLDKEPSADDVSCWAWTWENNVSELLLRT